MKKSFWKTPETLFMLVCLVLSGLASIFLGTLVAEPKVLFGRSLTAITPSLFPSLVLGLLFVICVIVLVLHFRASPQDDGATGIVGWKRGAVFFGIMTVYALLMVPIGFFLSSALAVSALSLYLGNRSILQIAILAIAGPVSLYLAATRLLAVSLPELNTVELFYARMLGG